MALDSGVLAELHRLYPDLDPGFFQIFFDSLNAAIDHQAGPYYDRLNILKLPATTRLDVGGRYDFKFHGAAVSLRAQVNNVTDSFRWQAAGDSNRVSANASRQYILRLAADY